MNRNMDRFSDDFMFQLNRGKFRNLMFQNGIPSFKAPFWHLKKWKVNMMDLLNMGSDSMVSNSVLSFFNALGSTLLGPIRAKPSPRTKQCLFRG